MPTIKPYGKAITVAVTDGSNAREIAALLACAAKVADKPGRIGQQAAQ